MLDWGVRIEISKHTALCAPHSQDIVPIVTISDSVLVGVGDSEDMRLSILI
jgi:hypothetical protein